MTSESFDWDGVYSGGGSDALEVDTQLLERVGGLTPGTALDLGCGAGGNALELARRGWDVLGIDVSSRAISSARLHAERLGVAASFEVGDLTGWSAPRRFDLVVSNFALPGAAGLANALTQAVEAVAPGGTLLVVDWERSMAARIGWAERDLVTVDDVVAALSDLTVEESGTEFVPAHDHCHADTHDPHHEDSGRGQRDDWVAVVVRARRPG